MTFDERGHITPYELIGTTLAELNEVFSEEFPLSITRRLIFDEFATYVSDLQRELNVPIEVWINGSFTTLTLNPNDIDFVIFVDSQIASQHVELIRLYRAKRNQEGSLTDGYFVETVPPGHPDYRIYQFNRDDRYRDFGFDRLNKQKGILQLIVNSNE